MNETLVNEDQVLNTFYSVWRNLAWLKNRILV